MSNSSWHDITELINLDEFAELVSKQIFPGSVLALHGELGTGKTTFTQRLLKTLGVTDLVTSPTFTLINEYQTSQNQPIYHLDLYRLKHEQELAQLGLEELLSEPNIVIIEWPAIAESLLPLHTIKLKFQHDDNQKRTVLFERGNES